MELEGTYFCMRDNKHMALQRCTDRACVYYPVCCENIESIQINPEPLPDEPESSYEEFTPYGFQTVMEEEAYLEDGNSDISVIELNPRIRPVVKEVYTPSKERGLFKIKVTKTDLHRELKNAEPIIKPADVSDSFRGFGLKTGIQSSSLYIFVTNAHTYYISRINVEYDGVGATQQDISLFANIDFVTEISTKHEYITIMPISANEFRVLSSENQSGKAETEDDNEDAEGRLGDIFSSQKIKQTLDVESCISPMLAQYNTQQYHDEIPYDEFLQMLDMLVPMVSLKKDDALDEEYIFINNNYSYVAKHSVVSVFKHKHTLNEMYIFNKYHARQLHQTMKDIVKSVGADNLAGEKIRFLYDEDETALVIRFKDCIWKYYIYIILNPLSVEDCEKMIDVLKQPTCKKFKVSREGLLQAVNMALNVTRKERIGRSWRQKDVPVRTRFIADKQHITLSAINDFKLSNARIVPYAKKPIGKNAIFSNIDKRYEFYMFPKALQNVLKLLKKENITVLFNEEIDIGRIGVCCITDGNTNSNYQPADGEYEYYYFFMAQEAE